MKKVRWVVQDNNPQKYGYYHNAFLGKVFIGVVCHNSKHNPKNVDDKFRYRCILPNLIDPYEDFFPTVEEAKVAFERVVQAWLKRANLVETP